jgi:hypothetical protein
MLMVPPALAACVLPACGDREDASLCTAYAEFLDSRAEIAQIDPANLDASNASDIAESALDGVRRLRQAADDRYEQEIENLDAAVNDLLLTLSAIPDDADFATWGPLVEDDLEAASDAATVVEDAIEPSCNPDTSGD